MGKATMSTVSTSRSRASDARAVLPVHINKLRPSAVLLNIGGDASTAPHCSVVKRVARDR